MTRSDIAALAMKEWLIDNSADAFVRMAQRAFDAGAEAHSVTQDAKDARRYRHMRNNAAFRDRNGPGLYWYLPRLVSGTNAERLDMAIDDAMKPLAHEYPNPNLAAIGELITPPDISG